MKKTIMSLVVMSLFLFSLVVVVAEEHDTEIELPEAKKIGFFGNSFDNLRLAFTFNQEKRIERALAMAEKRLAEAEALADEDPEAAERARERYEAFLEKAEKAMEKIAEKQANNPEESREGLTKLVRAENRLEAHKEKAEAIYLRTLERLQDNNASEERIAKLEEIYAKVNERLDNVEEKQLARRESAKERHKTLSGETDAEVDADIEEIEDEEGLTDAREKRASRAEFRIQKFTQIREREIQRFQARLESGNITEEQRTRITERIEGFEERTAEYEALAVRTQARRALNVQRVPITRNSTS